MDSSHDMGDLHRKVENLEAQLAEVKVLLQRLDPPDEQAEAREKAAEVGSVGEGRQGQVVEGVFDGQNMVGPDGRMYTVPANYASKSKLVEGDIMKLTITGDGSFVYKQIGPVDRVRVKGTLVRDENGAYRAVTKKGDSYRLLTASVTYYRGEPGAQVVLLKPQEMPSRWGAVENIVAAGADADDEMLFGDDEIPVGADDGFVDVDDAGGDYDDVDQAYTQLKEGNDALLEA